MRIESDLSLHFDKDCGVQLFESVRDEIKQAGLVQLGKKQKKEKKKDVLEGKKAAGFPPVTPVVCLEKQPSYSAHYMFTLIF